MNYKKLSIILVLFSILILMSVGVFGIPFSKCTTTDCDLGETCTSNICLRTCNNNAQCAKNPPQLCSSGYCKIVKCMDNSDCKNPSKPYCQLGQSVSSFNNICLSDLLCTNNYECSLYGFICAGGKCVTPPSTPPPDPCNSGICKTGLRCDLSTNTCAAYQYSTDKYCATTQGSTYTQWPQGYGCCIESNKCLPETLQKANQLAVPSENIQCDTDADCKPPRLNVAKSGSFYICKKLASSNTKVCAQITGTQCKTSLDCKDREGCDSNKKCSPAEAFTCTQASDCFSKINVVAGKSIECLQGTYGKYCKSVSVGGGSCSSDLDCHSSLMCAKSVCVLRLKDIGQSCMDTSYCKQDPPQPGVTCNTKKICALRQLKGGNCIENNDCTAGLTCIAGKCDVPAINSHKVGETCDNNNNCLPDLVCVNSKCMETKVAIDLTSNLPATTNFGSFDIVGITSSTPGVNTGVNTNVNIGDGINPGNLNVEDLSKICIYISGGHASFDSSVFVNPDKVCLSVGSFPIYISGGHVAAGTGKNVFGDSAVSSLFYCSLQKVVGKMETVALYLSSQGGHVAKTNIFAPAGIPIYCGEVNVACSDNTVCGGYKCMGGVCNRNCISTLDCDKGFTCSKNQCVKSGTGFDAGKINIFDLGFIPECKESKDCTDPNTGCYAEDCKTICTDKAECAAGQQCQDGFCLDDCTDSSTCAGQNLGLICKAGTNNPLKSCQECGSDASCTSDDVYGEDYLCKDGRCATTPALTCDPACKTDFTCVNVECKPNCMLAGSTCTSCDVTTGKCNTDPTKQCDPECDANQYCDSADLICKPNKCVPNSVDPSTSCPAGYTCNDKFECEPPQEICTNANCKAIKGEKYYCLSNTCVEHDCIVDSNCAAGETCENYECKSPIVTCGDGSGGNSCDFGESCKIDADCKVGMLCGSSKTCEYSLCQGDADCPVGSSCKDIGDVSDLLPEYGNCITNSCDSDTEAVDCKGLTCVNSVCVLPGDGNVDCQDDDECPTGYVCGEQNDISSCMSKNRWSSEGCFALGGATCSKGDQCFGNKWIITPGTSYCCGVLTPGKNPCNSKDKSFVPSLGGEAYITKGPCENGEREIKYYSNCNPNEETCDADSIESVPCTSITKKGTKVPGFGASALIVGLSIVAGFYFFANKKRRKM